LGDPPSASAKPVIVYYSDDVTDRMVRLCHGIVTAVRAARRHDGNAACPVAGRSAAVLFDSRTRDVAGAEVAGALREYGLAVQELLIADTPEGQSPVCDVAAHDTLTGEMGEVDLVVSVGSGVMNDLGKWIAFDRQLPFVTFATAASMNGYTSANVAATVGGVKTLIRTAAPKAVFADPRIIRNAPFEMTAGGVGDVLAKNVSSADWRLNHLLFGDDYDPGVVDLIADVEPRIMNAPADVARRQPEAINAVFDALLLTGIGMTLAGTSAPASGGEHLISHALDMLSGMDGRPHDLHGRQVGVGTVLTSALYERVLAAERPTLVDPPDDVDRSFWGPLAETVAEQYAQKRPRLQQARAALADPKTWDRIRTALSPMVRPAERVRNCLRLAGGAWRAEDIGCPNVRLLSVLRHAHEIRPRVTVLDLALLLGLLPGQAGQIAAEVA